MPENKISLYQLNQGIKKALKETLDEKYWVIAEISDLKINARGHCYLELVEKDKDSEELLAKARATIWAYIFKMLKPYFETTSGLELSVGLNVLLNVSVEFHEYYGLSLNVHDIDPVYTLGDLAQQRLETINRLKKEGVFDMNKNLSIPLVPQRIAVISSSTAAGYKDFIHQIENNEYAYAFYCKLFPATMQGQSAEESIISQLDKIYEEEEAFDVVVLIRGGGAQSDFHCFNNYWLSYHLAQFSLPVITGIGHEKDETVVDIIANTKLKTPTAVAEFLISRLAAFESNLILYQKILKENVKHIVDDKKLYLDKLNNSLVPLSQKRIHNEILELNDLINKFKNKTNHYFFTVYQKLQSYYLVLDKNVKKYIFNNVYKNNLQKEFLKTVVLNFFDKKKGEVSLYSKGVEYLDPSNILKRGYSITSLNNKIIKDPKCLQIGDILETKLYKGRIKSKVEDLKE